MRVTPGQTDAGRGDANKGRTPAIRRSLATLATGPRLAPGSLLSLSLSPSLLLFTVLISRVLVCLCI